MKKNSIKSIGKNEILTLVDVFYIEKILLHFQNNPEMSFTKYDLIYAKTFKDTLSRLKHLDTIFTVQKDKYRGEYSRMDNDTIISKRLEEVLALIINKINENIAKYKKSKTTFFTFKTICNDQYDLKNKDLTFESTLKMINLFYDRMKYLDSELIDKAKYDFEILFDSK